MKKAEEIKKGLECTADYIERTVGANNHSAMLRDALAYIQRLKAQAPRWINVEEGLPEPSDLVLVIANGKPRENIELHNAILIAPYWAEEGWIADGFEGWDGLIVSHWTPLPEPPKEG